MDFTTKLFILPVMIKVLGKTRKPLWCAIFYALGVLTNGLIFDIAMSTGGAVWGHVVWELAASFGLSWGYFILLNDLEGAGGPYWGVLLGGLCLLLWV